MATITVTTSQEIEATPETVAQALRGHAAKIVEQRFPHNEGDLIDLADEIVTNYRLLPGMPALVLAAPQHTTMGFVAAYSEAGPQVIVVHPGQVKGAFAV